MQKRFVLGFVVAVIAISIAPGCKLKAGTNELVPLGDSTGAPTPLQSAAVPAPVAPPVAAAAPPPVVATPAPKPSVVFVAAPKPPAPAQTTIIVQAAPTADPRIACRNRFTNECTSSCNTKVNQQVFTPQKRRIAHDICFGECTRAASNRCK